MKIRAFITHKQAEHFADCQDRFRIEPKTKSVAVSDGMGATWQQKTWAQILTNHFSDSPDWQPSHENIKLLCSMWRTEVVRLIQRLKEDKAPENKIFRNERNLAEGRSAGATFVGIRFDGDGNWKGTVLGDSCLIIWDGVIATFLKTPKDIEGFDSFPDYFDSNPVRQGKGTPLPIEGTLEAGATLLLASDPLSEFLFSQEKQEAIGPAIKRLLAVKTHIDFEEVVEEWRKDGMHNDDTTLVVIEGDGNGAFELGNIDDITTLTEGESQEPARIDERAANTWTKHEQTEVYHQEPDAIEPPGEATHVEELENLETVFKSLLDELIKPLWDRLKLPRKGKMKQKAEKDKILSKIVQEFIQKLSSKYEFSKKN